MMICIIVIIQNNKNMYNARNNNLTLRKFDGYTADNATRKSPNYNIIVITLYALLWYTYLI